MTASPETAPTSDRELVLSRLIDAPREKLFLAWTEPELLKQWFAPLPYTTPIAELDVRPGGANFIVMRDPQGNDLPNRGIYLEVVKNERLVFTDAYVKAWEPAEKPFNEKNLFATIYSALGIDPYGEFDVPNLPTFHRVEDKAPAIAEILA